MELIEEYIRKILPALEVDKMSSLMVILDELGVTEISDLSLVEEKDFKDIIKPIQARKLINAWKSAKPTTLRKKETRIAVCETRYIPSTLEVAENLNTATVFDAEWHTSFNVPWNKMPTDLLNALYKKKRPEPALRLSMVRIICSSIKDVCETPRKAELEKIAKCIVQKYPESFSDIICGELVSSGYASLARQLIIRFQNINRGSTLNVLKRKIRNDSNPTNKKILSSDKYGCVNWQPARLPDGENYASQQEKKDEMMKIFHQGPQYFKSSNFISLLNDTYYTQRTEINQKKSTEYLVTEWPLLFTTEGLLNHFTTLTGINITEKFHSAITNKGSKVVRFIELKPAGRSKKYVEDFFMEAMSEGCKNSFEYVIFLTMAYLGEKRDSLFITADNTATSEEVKNIKDLPNTPCLIICGETAYSGTSFILCIDSVIVCQDINTFENAVCMLFASFYCLNIQYPRTAAATLEFIQRCFLNINPSKGTKVSRVGTQKHQVYDPKVLTLLKGLADYKWVSN